MLIRFRKPRIGNKRMYELFILPFNRGIKIAPMINITGGGTDLTIIGFSYLKNSSLQKTYIINI